MSAPPARPARLRHPIFALGALATFALVVGLGLAEALVRGYQRIWPKRDRAYIRYEGPTLALPDTLLGWRPRPDATVTLRSPEYQSTLHTNKFGFRWTAWDSLAACRVVVIGDSFVAGNAVDADSLFWAVAARESHCSVVGLGVEGYSTDQELLLLREYLPMLRPTAVVLAFYDNDIWNNREASWEGHRKPRFEFHNGNLTRVAGSAALTEHPSLLTLHQVPQESQRNSKRGWLARHSRLSQLIASVVSPARLDVASAMLVAPLRDEMRVYHTPFDPDIAEAWVVTEALIREMARDAAAAGAHRFLLLHAPLRETVTPVQWQAAAEFWRMGPDWTPRSVQAELQRVCLANAIACLFPAEELRRLQESGTPAYFLGDPHWTNAGHRAVGRVLASALRPYPSAQ